MSIRDSWKQSQQPQLPFWPGDVFFEQLPFSSTSCNSFGSFRTFGTVVNQAEPCFPCAGGELEAKCLTCGKAATNAAAPVPNAVQNPGKQFENDFKHVAVHRDVKHVHFADVPADVQRFSLDAKDQAVLT